MEECETDLAKELKKIEKSWDELFDSLGGLENVDFVELRNFYRSDY